MIYGVMICCSTIYLPVNKVESVGKCCMCFRDREQYRSIKIDTEEDMNEMLRPSKQRAVVANAMFHKILDNVGLVAKDYNLARIFMLSRCT